MFDFDELQAAEDTHIREWLAADLPVRAARSAQERARASLLGSPNAIAGGSEQTPATGPKAEAGMGGASRAVGRFSGLALPRSQAELQDWGPVWLTRAFRAAGTIPEGTSVAALRRLRPRGVRGGAARLALEVAYAPAQSPLHQELLVKLPLSILGAEGESLALASLPPTPCPRLAGVDLRAEIQFYQLLEGAAGCPRCPRFYFGDVDCPTDGDPLSAGGCILITEFVSFCAHGVLGPNGTAVAALNLRDADFQRCALLVRAAAELAGASRAGWPGAPGLLERAFGSAGAPAGGPAGAARAAAAAVARRDARLGIGDTEFAVRARRAQELVSSLGRAFFPPEVRTEEAMTVFRRVLLGSWIHGEAFAWWLRCRPDFVALGHGGMEPEAAFVPRAGGELGVCDWHGVSVLSLGEILWRWLSCASCQVLKQHLHELVFLFAKTYSQSGGPELDVTRLAHQFIVAAIMQISSLVEEVQKLFSWCPKELWESLRGFSDDRICAHTETQGSVWRYVKTFVNAVVVINRYDAVPLMERLVPEIIAERAVGVRVALKQERPRTFSAAAEVEVRSEPSGDSALVARLPPGVVVFCWPPQAEGSEGERKEEKCRWIRIHVPLEGWASVARLAPLALPAGLDREPFVLLSAAAGPDLKSGLAKGVLFGLMAWTRCQYTGYTPTGTCVSSAMMLRNECILRDKLDQFLYHLGSGSCRVALGSFLAEADRRPWWPAGYEDWAHHSFVVFDDGTIADITADQFDDVPQLWWPADGARYSLDPRNADAAHAARLLVGIERWQALAAQDTTVVARTRFKWLEAEKEVGVRPGERPQRSLREERAMYHLVSDAGGWTLPAMPMAAEISDNGVVILVQQVAITQQARKHPGANGRDLRRLEFQLRRNCERDWRVYPRGVDTPEIVPLSTSGAPFRACGEPGQGHGRNWALDGPVGSVFKVAWRPQASEVCAEPGAPCAP